MKPRPLAVLSLLAFGAWVAACSSGLGNDPRRRSAATTTSLQLNLPLGLDVGVKLTEPASEPVIAGVVVPAIAGVAAREVALIAFSTAARSDDADGAGKPLARDATSDTNGLSDIFVAVVSAQDVERRAFSQSLAGKFRHPRCATCHSMQASDTVAFASSASGFGEPHAGPPPGDTFPSNQPALCAPCHVTSSTFPVDGWQAPAASFDMRSKTIAQLAQMARNVPVDEVEHFVSDKRVLWALDSGILPQVGGRNGTADDDHDGIVEPEDRDGVPRPVPGGSVAFLRDITNWRATATPGVPDSEVLTTAAAVNDITLVSRAFGTNNAGNGASTAPRVKFVPNTGFNPANPTATPIGTLFVAFQSTASNLVAIDANGAMDVFRAAIELRSAADGTLNLVALSSATLLCSARNGLSTPGDRASGKPSIGGAAAEIIAFESVATNLVSFTDGNGEAAADVYLRNVTSTGLGTTTLLVSHTVGNQAISGNGASTTPNVTPAGDAIAFESDATNLIALDANGVRDVYFATGTSLPFQKIRASVTGNGAEGTGGASRAASAHSSGGRVLVAFESDATNLASTTAPTNVFLFDSTTGGTTLLNQRVAPDPSAAIAGAKITIVGDGSARAPGITPDGATVAFESDAGNIDVLRSDTNRATDIFLVETAQLANGLVLPFRISVTATETASGNGASIRPSVGSFANSANFRVGLAAYSTAATDIGASDTTNIMLSFLDETSGVIANFTQSVTRGGAPLEVQFTDTSSGTPTAWAWDFDDDGLVDSTEQNPRHTFTTPGTQTVKLEARSPRSQGTKSATVLVVGTVVADFAASVTSGTAPLPVAFMDQSTESPLSWTWNFGDGGSSDLQNPGHSYTTPGTYTVSLTATNEVGATIVTKTGFITVFAPVTASFVTSPSPASGTAPFAVLFTSTATNAANLVWNFGDGSPTATGTPASHTYTSGGSFTATLTATGFGGDVRTATAPITALGTVDFSMTFGGNPVTSRYTGNSIQFTVTQAAGATAFAWNFGDGSTGSGASPTHTYTNASFPGAFTVTMTATNAPGGPVSRQRTLTIVPATELVTVLPSQDTTIFSNSGNNNGLASRLVVGKTYTAGFRRALLQFDIQAAVNSGALPATATINSAGTRVRLTDTSPTGTATGSAHLGLPKLTGTHTYEFRRLSASWAEGTGNGLPGIGDPSTGGGATFAARFTGANWGTSGGDFGGQTATIEFTNAVGSTFNSTSVKNDVDFWRANPSSNFGWLLKASAAAEGAGTSVASIKWFASSEHASVQQPVLEINFTRQLP